MVAFIVALIVNVAMALGIVAYANIRPAGRPTTWGEAMVGSAYVFMLFIVTFGIVPDQFIDWVDALGWDTERFFVGPGAIIEAQAQGGWFPFSITYQAIRDIIVVVQHVVSLALFPVIAIYWQKRGDRATAKEAAAATPSDFGRPLVREA
ncbi:MAG: hypothetical protein GXP35_00800 [Actinobacteria bacterium]|nr:hypothetical protein [Actinomycetota bacterium]